MNELPDNDATLSYIKVDGETISGYSKTKLNYTYDIPNGYDGYSLFITSRTSDPMASQSDWSFSDSTQKWSTTVTAEDGVTTKRYTVAVNELPSDDATLKNIKINEVDLPGFSPGTLGYTCDVAYGTNASALAVTSEPNDPAAEQGSWAYDAASKKWSVTVTAEDGTTKKTYTVTVNELPQQSQPSPSASSSVTPSPSPAASVSDITVAFIVYDGSSVVSGASFTLNGTQKNDRR